MKQKVLTKLCLLLPLVAAVLLMPQRSAAQTRIAVVSDPHVMAESLLPDDPTAESDWTAAYANERKMLDKSQKLFRKLVTTLTNMSSATKPQLLFISGDLTKDGETASHNEVIDQLDILEKSGILVYVIPGNHDIKKSTDKVYSYSGNGSKQETTAVTSADDFATYYADYGYVDESGNTEYDANSLSYVTEPVPGLVLLAIDSHTSSIPAATLTWICEKASAARAQGKQVIAMMHHPLIEHIAGASLYISTYTVGSNTNVRNALIEAGVNVILTGHFHTSDIAYDWNNDKDNGIYDINTGSLISYPCDYRMLTLSQDKQMLNVTTASLEETADLLPAGATSWKTWLEDRLKTIAVSKMNSSQYSSVITDEDDKAYLVNIAAEAFSLHAECDENNKLASESLLNSFKLHDFNTTSPVFNLAKATMSSTFSSMLKDISNYIDGSLATGHEDRTADRTLEISLPSLEEEVTLTSYGWATYCTGHDLDISLTDGVTAYIVTGTTADKTVLTPVTTIPAGEGFLLNGTASTYTLKPATEAVGPFENNELKGTLEVTVTPAESNWYVLSNKGNGPGFYPAAVNLAIPAHKAYLSSPSSGARMFSIGGDTNGISTLKTDDKTDQTIYTLQGTRAGNLRCGIYIQNGKKIIIK